MILKILVGAIGGLIGAAIGTWLQRRHALTNERICRFSSAKRRTR